MRVLTIRQPWAWAIAFAGKNVENREWQTRYRGELAIHAALRDEDDATMPRGIKAPPLDELDHGAIIAVADLVDVREQFRSKWFSGKYGLVLENVRPLSKPVACKGRLGLWIPTASEVRKIRARL